MTLVITILGIEACVIIIAAIGMVLYNIHRMPKSISRRLKKYDKRGRKQTYRTKDEVGSSAETEFMSPNAVVEG